MAHTSHLITLLLSIQQFLKRTHTLSFEWRRSDVSVTVSFASSWSGLIFYMVIIQNWETRLFGSSAEKNHIYICIHIAWGGRNNRYRSNPRRPFKVFYVTTASFSSFWCKFYVPKTKEKEKVMLDCSQRHAEAIPSEDPQRKCIMPSLPTELE
jgi:hypothetical protein